MISTIELYDIISSRYLNLYYAYIEEENLACRQNLFNSMFPYYELIEIVFYSFDE